MNPQTFDRKDRPQLEGPRPGFGAVMQSAIAKVAAVAVGALMLAGAIAVSIVVFAGVLVAVVAAGLYVWWKVRKIRKQIEAQQSEPSARWHGDVIEGEVIREHRNDGSARR
ncbi:MAG: hypothetical protein ACJ8MH_05525 [Povalibacter sp.]